MVCGLERQFEYPVLEPLDFFQEVLWYSSGCSVEVDVFLVAEVVLDEDVPAWQVLDVVVYVFVFEGVPVDGGEPLSDRIGLFGREGCGAWSF